MKTKLVVITLVIAILAVIGTVGAYSQFAKVEVTSSLVELECYTPVMEYVGEDTINACFGVMNPYPYAIKDVKVEFNGETQNLGVFQGYEGKRVVFQVTEEVAYKIVEESMVGLVYGTLEK